MFVQELFWSALGFDVARAETYRQVLSDHGWETLEDYAALSCEKSVEFGFLEGHAARFVRRLSTPIQKLQPSVSTTSGPITSNVSTATRRWTWTMINSEVTQYEQFCKGNEKKHGYGMAAFAKGRVPPYRRIHPSGEKKAERRETEGKLYEGARDSSVLMTSAALKTYIETVQA